MAHSQTITRCLIAAALAASWGMAQATEYSAPDAKRLQELLDKAQPGDVIKLSQGTFNGVDLTIRRSGKPGNPIVLEGPASAVIKSKDYGLHIENASYWRISGFTVDGAKKGIVLDNASHILLTNLTVKNVSEEGVHFRKNSRDNVLTASRVSDTGRKKKSYGEAVYVGTAQSNWKRIMGSSKSPDRTSNTCISNNELGPNVTTEAIDVKEGSSNTYIFGNRIDLSGITGENFGDSGFDLKGDSTYVFENKFANTKGTYIQNKKVGKKVPDAIQTHRIDNPANVPSGTNIWAWSNTADLKSKQAPRGYTPGMLFRTDGNGNNHYCAPNTVAAGDSTSDLGNGSCGSAPPKVPTTCPDVLR